MTLISGIFEIQILRKMSTNKTIGVLGCGWLGLPLALALKKQDYNVKGSVTSIEKKQTINNQLSDIYVLKVEEDGIEGELDFFKNISVLVIAIPPGLRGNQQSDFTKKINQIIQLAIFNNITSILYVSSTAVFANNNNTYDENTVPVPYDSKSEQLIIAEQLIREAKIPCSIIRMGGLIDEHRHPVTTLSKQLSVKNPLVPVNIIHQKDAIGLILSIINNEKWGFIFHGVAPTTWTKQEYYTKEALKRNISLTFDIQNQSVGKKVLSQISTHLLNYTYSDSL